MAETAESVGIALGAFGEHRQQLKVTLSKELITLLSEQLYQSPSKAVEELVVNSFDADAPKCYVVVPIASAGTDIGRLPVISVYDNGIGMDLAGLTDLWRVGASSKREEATVAMRKRTQIGKFGIGKLATYALANRITYLTSSGVGEILGVSLSFSAFKSDPVGPEAPVELEVRSLSLEDVLEIPEIDAVLHASKLDPTVALNPAEGWTLVLLEELKERAGTLQPGRLRWVLRTAMPMASDFQLFLNGEEITSAKEDYVVISSFAVTELSAEHLGALDKKTGQEWRVEDRPAPGSLGDDDSIQPALVCELFNEGITGRVIVTEKSLYGGKSADLTRSHGFFVRVRGRLVSDEDPLFGLHPQSYQVFNRFRADIDADDLDQDLTAPREGVGISERRTVFSEVLLEIFYEARRRYQKWEDARAKPEDNKPEEKRNYVDPRNVERPTADVLIGEGDDDVEEGADADGEWFYVDVPPRERRDDVVDDLYGVKAREPYQYAIESLGASHRLVRFSPEDRKFTLNADHELVIEYEDNPRARDLLYDLATAEALLEVYLREYQLPPHLIGEILERRDNLLRSLAKEQVRSNSAIAASLRNSVASERDLEISLVIAARALGFVAKHLSGATNPDGVARLRDYPQGERKITLEAKSSIKVPSLGAIDFAGLAQHVKDQSADGCLLVAPDYPGGTRGADAAAAKRSEQFKISCWTVDQLARVIYSIESHHITARQVLDIVLTTFTPEDVAARVESLLQVSSPAPQALALGIIDALFALEAYVPTDRVRSVDMILPELGRAGLKAPADAVRRAVQTLAAASQGAMTIRDDDRFVLNTSIEELARRVASITGGSPSPRRASTFREQVERPDWT